jgi:hypothetical protein
VNGLLFASPGGRHNIPYLYQKSSSREGYGVFSVSEPNLQKVAQHIRN